MCEDRACDPEHQGTQDTVPMTVGGKEVERKRNEEKSWFCARENRKKRHDVCRSSRRFREIQFMFLYVKNVGSSRKFKTFQHRWSSWL